MPSARDKLHWLGRTALVVADVLVVLVLILTAALIWLERGWVKPNVSRQAEDAFRHGTIGTEVMPLAVAAGAARSVSRRLSAGRRAGG